MKLLKNYFMVFCVAAVAVSSSACRRSDDGAGPAEEAGRKIDKALERLGDETGRLMEEAGKKLQKYGESTKENPPRNSEESAAPNR